MDKGFHPSKVSKAQNGKRYLIFFVCPSRSILHPSLLCIVPWWVASTGLSCPWLSDGLAVGDASRRLESERREKVG